jgi:O-antigen biosynthesis alpha-1,3-mannosyltransferase
MDGPVCRDHRLAPILTCLHHPPERVRAGGEASSHRAPGSFIVKVGFDGTGILGHGGLKTYARELIRAMAVSFPEDSFILLTRGVTRKRRLRELFEELPNVLVRGWIPHPGMLGARLSAVTGITTSLAFRIAGADLDLVHLTDPFGTAALPGRFVATVNDLFPLTRQEHRNSPLCTAYAGRTPRILRRAAAVIVPSVYVAGQIGELYPGIRPFVTVIPDAVGEAFVPASAGTDTPPGREYFLFVSRPDERKNLSGLLEAYAWLPEAVRTGVGLTLVLSGPPANPPVLNGASGVRVLRGVPDGELIRLYQEAQALVFPSLDEGFGLPVLEAMGCGCPVITSNCSSLPEVAGGAALLVDPFSPASIADAMERIAGSPELRRKHSAAGRKRASELTWGRTARETMEVYCAVRSVPR